MYQKVIYTYIADSATVRVASRRWTLYHQEDYVYKERESLITPTWEVTTVTYTVRSQSADRSTVWNPEGNWRHGKSRFIRCVTLGLKCHELSWRHRRMCAKFCKPSWNWRKFFRKFDVRI